MFAFQVQRYAVRVHSWEELTHAIFFGSPYIFPKSVKTGFRFRCASRGGAALAQLGRQVASALQCLIAPGIRNNPTARSAAVGALGKE
jgi:hypothetical protein